MFENIEQKKEKQEKERKKQEIRALGFSKEKAIEYLNRHITIDNLKRKIQFLQSLGFKNPISLIEKFPPIIGYDTNRIIQLPQFLQSLGFKNPISLIEKYPTIAGHDIHSIEKRIELIKRLNTKFQLQINPIEIIEDFPHYLGYDLKRIFFYLRIASFYNFDKKFYRDRFIKQSPFVVFNILYNLYLQNKISDRDEFKRLIMKLKIFPKETKQEIQNKIKNNLPRIIENLKQKQDDPNARFLLKLAGYLEALLKKEEERKKREGGR